MHGRIQATVPDVLGDSRERLGDAVRAVRRRPAWASSRCPPSGAGVWIEFEHGDPDYPIWSGCLVGLVDELPADAALRRRTRRS